MAFQAEDTKTTTFLLQAHYFRVKAFMPRIAFCITELYIGGAERALCELATRLDKNKFDVVVYSLQRRPADDAQSCVPMLEQAGIPVFFLDMKGPRSFFSGLFKLRCLLSERRPDLFLSFLFHANFLGRLAAWSVGVEHVLSGIRVAEKRNRWHLTLDRWTSRLVEKYVCVSESVAEFSATVGGLPRSKLVVIPNAVEVRKFRNALKADLTGNRASTKSRKAIYVGRIDDQKGVDRLLDLAITWLAGSPVFWELLIVGDGPKQAELTDQWLRREFDVVRPWIHLLGWRGDVPELLAASDLFVLPSHWEGMPNVVLQAMAAGLPIVSTPVEGVSELLGDLAEEQVADFDNWAERLEKVPEISGLGELNRQRATDFFSWERIVSTYEALFGSILEKNEPK